MKYRYRANDSVEWVYKFEVLDKFDEPDEAKRFDEMLLKQDLLQNQLGVEVEVLWIKTTPII